MQTYQQWGFQGKKSTILALLIATYDWFRTSDTGDDIGAVFFDIKKVFDTIPHHTLIQKLKALNISSLDGYLVTQLDVAKE